MRRTHCFHRVASDCLSPVHCHACGLYAIMCKWWHLVSLLRDFSFLGFPFHSVDRQLNLSVVQSAAGALSVLPRGLHYNSCTSSDLLSPSILTAPPAHYSVNRDLQINAGLCGSFAAQVGI